MLAATGATYSWGQISGPAATLSAPTSATTTFTPAASGVYVFRLTASNDAGIGNDTVTVTVSGGTYADPRTTCDSCHTSAGVGLGIYTNWSSSAHKAAVSCANCHIGADGGSHPGATPTNTTCKSCHTAAPVNHAAATLNNCLACHNPHNLSASTKVSLTSGTTAGPYEAGQTTLGVPSATGYVGAAACQACHNDTYAKWSNTLHNKPLKSVAAQGDSIFVNDSNNNGINDFKDGLNLISTTLPYNSAFANPSAPYSSGTYANPFANYTSGARSAAGGTGALALSYTAGDNKYWMQIGNVKYEVVRTQGGNGKWKQRYHTKIGNAFYLLPLQYDEANRKYEAYNLGNWYNNTNPHAQLLITGTGTLTDTNETAEVRNQVQQKLLTRSGVGSNGPSAGAWDNRCASCHQTGVSIEFKVGPGSTNAEVIASSVDLNVGCESCHGPGADHVAGPTAANIKNPSEWANNATGAGALNYYRANEVCGNCHSRTEGFAHFSSSMYGKVVKGIEAPSQNLLIGSEPVKAKSYNIGEKVLDYIYKNIPTMFISNGTTVSGSTTSTDGNVGYEGGTRMQNYKAASGHHQQWHDMELGKHGAVQQMGLNQGLTCFSCHDAHSPNSGNIRASITKNGVVVPTASEDNTLCLACHAGQVGTAFANLSAAVIKNNPLGSAVKDAVVAHMSAKSTCTDGATAGTLQDKYLQSVQSNGTTSATFAKMAVYKVGQCISCHMPFTSKSGIYTATNANGRQQGDQRYHGMKTVWPKLSANGLAATGTGPTVVTSCSACHVVPAN